MLPNHAKIPQNAEESVLEISQNPQKSISPRVEIHKEITEEILSRLPVKSILRFRCVSTSWRSLIDSKRFIKTHLQNSARNPSLAHHKVLFHNKSIYKKVPTLMRRPVLDSSEDQALELEFPIDFHCIVGCCNGLVCLVGYKQFVLWNPSTGISKKLPPYFDDYKTRSICYNSCGFGWDESSGDYKVFATATMSARAIAKMYSLKRDSWKEVKGWDSWKTPDWCTTIWEMGVLASGSLHWERYYRRGVYAFDLKREVLGAVELPESREGRWWEGIGVIGECLSLYNGCEDSSYLEIWMKKESWEKVVVLDQKCNPLHISPALAPFWGGGFLLIKIGNFLVFDGKGFRKVVSLKDSNVYIESLVSPLEA
ncbi:F-box/kelch-repeat protein At3g23880-like [Salvia miltiorrhiza]|uniref:F-box/kelch-repeat protein At3g23880-like n=1 Tax=Salvia miltiorrhiza TaxID=226208 RepID=UPI0025AD725E|nr:F-box/kelch-repeat protein At3g23880-like [Salvia miltiorrhiza]